MAYHHHMRFVVGTVRSGVVEDTEVARVAGGWGMGNPPFLGRRNRTALAYFLFPSFLFPAFLFTRPPRITGPNRGSGFSVFPVHWTGIETTGLLLPYSMVSVPALVATLTPPIA